MGTEILASILGLGFIGWLIDRWWGTRPWVMVGGLILGLIGGLYNAVRKASRTIAGAGAAARGDDGSDSDGNSPSAREREGRRR